MSKLLTTAASAVLLLTATGAYATDNYTRHNLGQNAAIQKGESASTKAYGYNKQGDHYNTNNVRRDNGTNSYYYPGTQAAYGTKQGVVIRKGGSAISDASTNESSRQYGAYWN